MNLRMRLFRRVPVGPSQVRPALSRRIAVATAVGGVVVAGCSGPTIPLSVGLADRPVDLLLGERAAAVATAPIPSIALPPALLPDFDLPFLAAFPADFTATPPTAPAFSFPSYTTPPTTIPVGCTATPPARHFDDSPDNIVLPPLETPKGDDGYVTRTSGRIEVGSDEVATTVLPQLTKRRVENIEIHSHFPATNNPNEQLTYDNYVSALGQPSDFTFEVVVDVGKAEHNTRTKYRVKPGYVIVTGYDSYTAAPDGTIVGSFPDGVADDFFTDRDRGGWIDDIEMFDDQDKNGTIEPIERYIDLNGDGVITTTPSTSPTPPTVRDERYQDITGDGFIGGWVTNATTGVVSWRNSAPVVDSNHDGVGDRSETAYPNYRYHYSPDGLFDSPGYQPVGGGFYLVSMQTGKQSPVVFSKVEDGDGNLVDAPGALLATLPFVESSTVNSKTYDASGKTAIQFESTVFGRDDVDVCRTDLVSWKIELLEGRLFGATQALDFTATYAIGSQYGGLILEEKSVVTSIQAGDEPVRRVVESVFTAEPAAAVLPT